MAMIEPAKRVSQPFPLYTRFPELAAGVPRLALSSGPSPVKKLRLLGQRVGGLDIWLKNDGVYGTVYGGNKPRKLEFVLADALRRGSRTLLTTGALGTNHGLAAALYGRDLGLNVSLLLCYEQPSPEVRTSVLRMAESGAEVHYTRSYPLTAALAPYYVAKCAVRDRRIPHIQGPGGSSPLAALGYVNAALELAGQVRSGELPEPRSIVIPLGTGGTVAGLLAGLRLAGLDSEVLAVAVTHAPTAWRPAVLHLAGSTAKFIARRSNDRDAGHVQLSTLRIFRDWIGPGLGRGSAASGRAQAIVHDLEGLELDPTYGAKAMAAVIGLANLGSLPAPVLFWQTFNAIPLPQPSPAAATRLPASIRRLCGL